MIGFPERPRIGGGSNFREKGALNMGGQREQMGCTHASITFQ